MDCIHINGIRSYGYLGYFPEEQVLGQWFEVDVTLWLDLSKPGKSDALEDTLDYSQVVATVQQWVKTSKFALIERLADAIASSLLETERVTQVGVKVTKPSAPIPDFDGKIAVEIIRTKQNSSLSSPQV